MLGFCIVRFKGKRALECPDGVAKPFAPGVGNTEVIKTGRVLRVEFERPLECPYGVIEPFLLDQGNALVVMRPDIVRLDLDCFVKRNDRFERFAEP